MRILLVYGSPRKNGNTALLAEQFRKGALENGHEVTNYYLYEKKISPCLACDYCQSHKGNCIQKDDFLSAYDLLQASDMLVIAAPVYSLGLPGSVKTFLDRTYAESAVGRHITKAALLTAACKEDLEVTKVMVDYFEKLTAYLGWSNLGTVSAYKVANIGEVKDSPSMEQAYLMGKSIL
ncbi:MAG: flavodoxin family protein [Clostridiales bacterium]|nr:flavodoxin family protein [Clostridiales bacterium]